MPCKKKPKREKRTNRLDSQFTNHLYSITDLSQPDPLFLICRTSHAIVVRSVSVMNHLSIFSMSLGLGSPMPSSLMANKQSLSGRQGLS